MFTTTVTDFDATHPFMTHASETIGAARAYAGSWTRNAKESFDVTESTNDVRPEGDRCVIAIEAVLWDDTFIMIVVREGA